MKEIIHDAFEGRVPVQDKNVIDAILQTMSLLDQGKPRVSEKIEGKWQTHAWIKEAILLNFR